MIHRYSVCKVFGRSPFTDSKFENSVLDNCNCVLVFFNIVGACNLNLFFLNYSNHFKIDLYIYGQHEKKTIYSDHFSLNLIFKNLPLKSNLAKRGQKFPTWNTNRVGGWEVFKMLTENNNKLKSISSQAADTSIMMKKKQNSVHLVK